MACMASAPSLVMSGEEAVTATEAAMLCETERPDADGERVLDERTAEVPKMSKNQLKKLRRQERTEVKNAYKKAKEKEKKKAVAEERKKASQDLLAGMSQEERQAELERRKDGRIQRLREKAQRKERQRGALQGGADLVIDLEFGDLMEPHERKSLMQQLMYSYNRNSQGKQPFRLCLTGVAGPMKEQVHGICGFSNWLVVSEERSYLERFADRTSDLVYLTADAEDTVEQLEPDKIYIIGGIVDRNRHKRLTYNKAQAQGIAMAKLPIGEHLRLASSKVLTVNHVVELLVRYKELNDWQKALEMVVPTRKRVGEEQDRQGTRPRLDANEGEGEREDGALASGTAEVTAPSSVERNGADVNKKDRVSCQGEDESVKSVLEAVLPNEGFEGPAEADGLNEQQKSGETLTSDQSEQKKGEVP